MIDKLKFYPLKYINSIANKINKMIIFAGPFVGEFGWELVFWHGWLRKIKKDLYPNSFFIVSSFPGRNLYMNLQMSL